LWQERWQAKQKELIGRHTVLAQERRAKHDTEMGLMRKLHQEEMESVSQRIQDSAVISKLMSTVQHSAAKLDHLQVCGSVRGFSYASVW